MQYTLRDERDLVHNKVRTALAALSVAALGQGGRFGQATVEAALREALAYE